MKIKYILFIACIAFVQVAQAKNINYTPKSLQRELQRKWNLSVDNLKEVKQLSDLLVKEGKFFTLKQNAFLKGYVFVGRVYSCRAGGCDAQLNEKSMEGSEFFDVYIIFDINKAVKSVKVYNYQATHGYEITSKGWLKQFIGFSGSSRLEVGKDIDSISGATISVFAITDEVNYLTEMLKLYK